MIGGEEFRGFPIGGFDASTSFEDFGFLKSPPWLSCPILFVFKVLGESVWRSYWRGLVGLVLFAEGGNFVPEMEEMFVRRLFVFLWEKNLFFLFNSV